LSVIVLSCKVRPCQFVRHCPVLQCQALLVCPSLSCPAMSYPAFSAPPKGEMKEKKEKYTCKGIWLDFCPLQNFLRAQFLSFFPILLFHSLLPSLKIQLRMRKCAISTSNGCGRGPADKYYWSSCISGHLKSDFPTASWITVQRTVNESLCRPNELVCRPNYQRYGFNQFCNFCACRAQTFEGVAYSLRLKLSWVASWIRH